jgi:hypothetical protein
MPQTGHENVSMAQFELLDDLDVVRQFGERHPDAFVTVWFENTPTVRLVALLSGDDVADHESELRQGVAYPDRLEVRRSKWSKSDRRNVRAALQECASDAIASMGDGRGVLRVQLWADQADRAEEICQRFGAAVSVTIGMFPYPDRFARPDRDSGTALDEPPPQHLATLPETVRVEPTEKLVIRSGAHLRTVIRVRNDSTTDVAANTNGQINGTVVHPDTGQRVGCYEGAQLMPLVRFDVPPGSTSEIPLLVGTASTKPELGWAVPPGPWAVRLVLSYDGEGAVRILPLEIVP